MGTWDEAHWMASAEMEKELTDAARERETRGGAGADHGAGGHAVRGDSGGAHVLGRLDNVRESKMDDHPWGDRLRARAGELVGEMAYGSLVRRMIEKATVLEQPAHADADKARYAARVLRELVQDMFGDWPKPAEPRHQHSAGAERMFKPGVAMGSAPPHEQQRWRWYELARAEREAPNVEELGLRRAAFYVHMRELTECVAAPNGHPHALAAWLGAALDEYASRYNMDDERTARP